MPPDDLIPESSSVAALPDATASAGDAVTVVPEPVIVDPDMPSPEQDPLQVLAAQVAAELGESDEGPLQQIKELIHMMGAEFVQTLLAETTEIERNGGMLMLSGKRRRTPGGVFFFQAKQKMTPEQQAPIFGVKQQQPKKEAVPASERPVMEEPQPQFFEPAPIVIGPQARQIAQNVARQLRESDPERVEVFARIAQVGGADLARVALEITLDMELQGGLRKRDGTRRSAGGSFLYIASRRMNEMQRRQVWPQMPEDLTPPAPAPRPVPPAPAAPAEGRAFEIRTMPRPMPPAGIATTAKLTLVGRPTDIQKQSGYLMFQLTNNRPPNLPRGIPTPSGSTVYTVIVADRQWSKVAGTADELEDAIIIEGYPILDPSRPGVTVYATNLFTKFSQQRRPHGE